MPKVNINTSKKIVDLYSIYTNKNSDKIFDAHNYQHPTVNLDGAPIMSKLPNIKLFLHCPMCMNQGKICPHEIFLKYEGNNPYPITCPNNHSYSITIQNPLFELLFESGVIALIDGYAREAIFNFSSSLEQFHEFGINAILTETGTNEEDQKKLWNSVASQSERQLGAFFYLYQQNFKTLPPDFILNSKHATLRNKVIHKGYFPKKTDAEKFGKEIYDYIWEVSAKLKEHCPRGEFKSLLGGTSNESNYQVSLNSVLNVSRSMNRGFDKALEDIKCKERNFEFH